MQDYVFLMLLRNISTKETTHIRWYGTFKCKCRLDASVSNNNVNAKNWLTKEYVIKDLFGLQVIVNVNVINYGCWRIFRLRKLKW